MLAAVKHGEIIELLAIIGKVPTMETVSQHFKREIHRILCSWSENSLIFCSAQCLAPRCSDDRQKEAGWELTLLECLCRGDAVWHTSPELFRGGMSTQIPCGT